MRISNRPLPALILAGLFLPAVQPRPAAQTAPLPSSWPRPAERGQLALRPLETMRARFQGEIGRRLHANADQWLRRAPTANPGMLEMFRVRDRTPAPNLVPWAGEFVGKYLLSAIQSLRLTDDPALRDQVAGLIAELLSTQAEDGYLGPFPKAARLKGHWDLWGHYHVMQALLLWHEFTGDTQALAACQRAADLMARTFLEGNLRVFDAGSHEMNMAVIHGLGQLYRRTGEERYLQLMREIEKDWERAGDYLRTGLAGVEFFQTPRPRWESLHDLQGLLEFHRITGEPKYRTAFEHHWRSILRWDRHNTGGFTSGEQATGNPYAPGAIETCCTVAWMLLTSDQLALTGDPLAADELELATFNGAAGSQHPSGSWWTYNTPMDGVREASAHSIVFQARAGTPELNCCSVNGPRALGLLADWPVMTRPEGLVVNYYGPAVFTGRMRDGTDITLRQITEYPRHGGVKIILEPSGAREFSCFLRIPRWSAHSSVRVNGAPQNNFRPGRYYEIKRRWQPGDVIELELDVRPRFVAGDREARGKVSVYRGPLLLAYDQRWNEFDEENIPPLELQRLAEARVSPVPGATTARHPTLAPWLLVDLPAGNGRSLRLCDFASAGVTGTRYRSWLAADAPPPPPPVTRLPADGAILPAAATWFKWTTRTNAWLTDYRVLVAETPAFEQPVLELPNLRENRLLLDESGFRKLAPDRWYYWKVIARGPHGETDSVHPPTRFKIDPRLPAPALMAAAVNSRPDALLVKAPLRGHPAAEFGNLRRGDAFESAAGRANEPNQAVALNGKQMLVYSLEEFPEEDYSVSVWVRIDQLPEGRIGQIFSAWARGMDDPLRLTIDRGQLFARIEAQQGYSTPGAPVKPGRWYHVAAVKSGGELTLHVDGRAAGRVAVPLYIGSGSTAVALGGNPNYPGNEFLAAAFADFAFYGRALSPSEVAALAKTQTSE